MEVGIIISVLLLAATLIAGLLLLKQRNVHLWAGEFYLPSEPDSEPRRDPGLPRHVFIAICDHFEPRWGGASFAEGQDRVRRWVQKYPQAFADFSDASGRCPQHTFFFPQDEYAPEFLEDLAGLCRRGFGDVDVHLHHHNDTPDGFREKLEEFRDTLRDRHGLLRKDPHSGRVVYGFIHGNWALCNSRPDGYCCGVDQELGILRDTGCYADFTMPSAPSNTQTRTVNSIYYARDIPGRRKSHDRGVRARVGQSAPADHLLMIQGPLCPDWSNRKFGLLPRIENADLHLGRDATIERLKLWLSVNVHVAGRPDWTFIKLHTHGCKDGNIDTLLGEPTRLFHRQLADFAAANPQITFHYVTAWEMAQLVHQAEAGAEVPVLTEHSTSAIVPAAV